MENDISIDVLSQDEEETEVDGMWFCVKQDLLFICCLAFNVFIL